MSRSGSGATFWPAWGAMTRRAVLLTLRNRGAVVMGVVQSVVFLLIFRFVFGGAIDTGRLDYVDYMVPGLLCVAVLFSVMGVGTTMADEVHRDVLQRYLSLPAPRLAFLAGRAAGQLLLTAVVLSVTLLCSFALGWRPSAGAVGVVHLLGLCAVEALAFTCLFMAVGLATGNVQAAQAASFLVMPFSFVSSAYVPVETMPRALQVLAENQPVTMIVDAARALALGSDVASGLTHPVHFYVTGALLWAAGIIVVTVPLAVRQLRRV